MKTTKFTFRVILVAFVFLFFDRCTTSEKDIYSDLMNYANTVKVVNTHEHQRWPDDLEFETYNFWVLLSKAYLNADLVSAGGPYLSPENLKTKALDELWEENAEFLEYTITTSYYQHFLEGLKKCYGYEEASFTKAGIETLSEQIAENYKDYRIWFDSCFHKFNFETMLLDQYWAPHNSNIDKEYYSFVLQTNPLTSNIARAKLIYHDTNEEILKLKEKSGVESVQLLGDYLDFAEALIKDAKENGAVALKNSQAYWRTIEYERVEPERAAVLFNKAPELTREEVKELQDFMFHWILKKAAEYNLPVQIHTGYLAGNGNRLENGKPIKLNNLFLEHRQTKFDLFHGGFPWTGEWIALAKMFPNVYLDLVWLPQISKQRAVVAFEEMLDCVPYNKFLWGGDCHFIEETIGSLEFGKQVVCEVLAIRIEKGQMDMERAKKIISCVFRDNALELFNLNPE